MKCPVCNETNLVMSERQGIEIDYCPQCRGVWLDRGELDKIIERIPVGRLGKASEIARAIRFLTDDDAGFITGSTLSINGGQHMY